MLCLVDKLVCASYDVTFYIVQHSFLFITIYLLIVLSYSTQNYEKKEQYKAYVVHV